LTVMEKVKAVLAFSVALLLVVPLFQQCRAGKPDFWASYPITRTAGLKQDTLFTLHIVRGENEHQWWESRYLQSGKERQWRDAGGLKVREYMKAHSADWVLCLIEPADGDTVELCDACFIFEYGTPASSGSGLPAEKRMELAAAATDSSPERGRDLVYAASAVKDPAVGQDSSETPRTGSMSVVQHRCVDYVFTDGRGQFKVFAGKHAAVSIPNGRMETTKSGYVPVWIGFEHGSLNLDHSKDGDGIESPFPMPEWVGFENTCAD
jgi:hypothetical protein